ncbi:MAG: hypothetical protein RIC16_16765 [Rhodospirillales bacterium]
MSTDDLPLSGLGDPSIAPRNVLVMPYNVNYWVYERLIPYMRGKYGTRFVVLVPEGRREEIAAHWCVEGDKVVTHQEMETIADTDQAVDFETKAAKACDFEARYGTCYMRDIIQLDRSMSTSFLSHAPWSPIAAMRSSDASTMIGKINHLIEVSAKLFDEERIDLALVWPLEALSASICAVAEGTGVPVSYPYVSSRKGLLHWSPSAYADDSQHRVAFEQMPESDPIPMSEVVPPDSVLKEIADMDRQHALPRILTEIARKCFHWLEFKVLDIKKLGWRFYKVRRMSTAREIIQDLYKWWFYKKIGSMSERRIEAFEGRPFVYYGLALEPEFSIQARSKEFTDQSTVIRHIAMSLPAGYDLVIKEHVLLGRRPISYYRDLLKFPNIRMAHPSVRGVDLAARAEAVATMASSVTLEAGLLGKPVMEFSKHTVFSFMPHVETVTSIHEMRDVLTRLLAPKTEKEITEIRRNAARLLKAIEAISFNGEGSPIFRQNDIRMDDDGIARMGELLVTLFRAKKAGLTEKYASFPST